ncbi:25559_t:CDS:2, partial [Dentiscutata erythropus]
LLLSSSFDSVLVVVDQLSKMAYFLACYKDITAKQTAQLVLHEIVRLYVPLWKIRLQKAWVLPYFISNKPSSLSFRVILSFQIHNVFHVSLLEPYEVNDIPDRYINPPSPVVVEREPEYEDTIQMIALGSLQKI